MQTLRMERVEDKGIEAIANISPVLTILKLRRLRCATRPQRPVRPRLHRGDEQQGEANG